MFGWEWIAAASLTGVIHAALGPDHTLPFVMLARARGWTRARALAVTLLCGLGHVGSSLALVGAGLLVARGLSGLAESSPALERIDALRGGLAAWGLVAFGLAYTVWGVRRACRTRTGFSLHAHGEIVHIHSNGLKPHDHAHPSVVGVSTFWTLFLLLALGPCEPLLAVLLPPAAMGHWGLVAAAGLVFAASTLGTMLLLVGLAYAGIERLRLGSLERWSHAVAGGVMAASGLFVAL